MIDSRVQQLFPRKVLLFVSVILLSLSFLALTACQSNANKEPANADPAESSSAISNGSSAIASGPALEGGTIVLGITQEPDYLDPHRAISAGTKELLFNVYEGLFKLDPEGIFTPALAKSYEVEDNGKSLIIHLAENVKFHDGSLLNIDDVLYSLSRAAGKEDIPPMSPALAALEFKPLDEQSLVISSKEFNPDLLASLSVGIIKSGSGKGLHKNPCGTGPFKITDYQSQNLLVLEKFPEYHGKAAYLDRVLVQILADRDAATIDLRSGQIDIFPYLGPEKIDELSELYNIVGGSANMVQLWAFNNAQPPLDNPEIRKALLMAIDRKAIIDLVMDGHGQAIYSGLSPALHEYYADDLEGLIPQQVEQAKAIIKKHFPNGLNLSCKVPGNYIIHVDTAEVLHSQLAAVGVNLEIERVDWLSWLEEVYANRNYSTTIIALTYDEYTARCALERYASTAENNFINFKNEDYDKLLQTALNSTDPEVRIESYQGLQKILTENAASAFLQDPASLTAVRKTLAGYQQYPAYVQDLSLVFFTDPEALEQSKSR
ncbi:MAG: ABC transporter substrate-binding protein [Eubacteriales bacterium]|nr:ABC transporter substrate-binding protein [Eubacteriales bacterium]